MKLIKHEEEGMVWVTISKREKGNFFWLEIGYSKLIDAVESRIDNIEATEMQLTTRDLAFIKPEVVIAFNDLYKLLDNLERRKKDYTELILDIYPDFSEDSRSWVTRGVWEPDTDKIEWRFEVPVVYLYGDLLAEAESLQNNQVELSPKLH